MASARGLFVGFNALVALAIGGLAIAAPSTLLEGKGVSLPNAAAEVWVREVGVLIAALGVTLWRARREESSPALSAVFLGAALVHWGLLPVELWAHASGTIPALSSVLPNSILHAVMGAGFVGLSLNRGDNRVTLSGR